jgi:hypothetical protein
VAVGEVEEGVEVVVAVGEAEEGVEVVVEVVVRLHRIRAVAVALPVSISVMVSAAPMAIHIQEQVTRV